MFKMKTVLPTMVFTLVASGLLAACGGGGSAAPAVTTVAQPPATGSAAAAWRPAVTDTWQWQLRGTVNTAYPVAVYDIDLFDTPVSTIQALQTAGKRVVCYFSAGSAENWRPDYGRFQASDMGNDLIGWPGERWLDTGSANVRQIMRARLDLASSKGCNGVEPDNVEAYANGSGFALTAATQLDFNRFLAAEAHSRGLAVALKNDVGQLADLGSDFDFAVNEQCHAYSECDRYQVFVASGKPVFNAEYAATYVNDPVARQALCADARTRGLQTLVLPLALDDSFRYSCGQN